MAHIDNESQCPHCQQQLDCEDEIQKLLDTINWLQSKRVDAAADGSEWKIKALKAEAEVKQLRGELAVAEHRVESHAVLLSEFAVHVQNANRERDEARAAAKLIMDEELSDCPATRLGYELAFPWLKTADGLFPLDDED